MFCKNCGKPVADDAKFCVSCGTKIDEPPVVDEPTAVTETPVVTEPPVDAQPAPQETATPVTDNKKANVVKYAFLGGLAAAAVGVFFMLLAVVINLIVSEELVLFDGSEFADFLTGAGVVLMLLGLVAAVPAFILSLRWHCFPQVHQKLNEQTVKVIALVLAVACVGFSTWGVIAWADSGTVVGGGGSSSSSSIGSSQSGLSKTLGLSVKVDSIKKSDNFTYVYCTIKNVSGTYGSATQYRYVKVKGVFKDKSGQIVDTDWTYAVDSAWLKSGESKTFYFMIRNTNIKTATLSLID